MKVNAYVEFFDETRSAPVWERCAEFKYSDCAKTYAVAAHNEDPRLTYRVIRCHDDDQYGANGIVWHSDEA